jgi:hypothetical protein
MTHPLHAEQLGQVTTADRAFIQAGGRGDGALVCERLAAPMGTNARHGLRGAAGLLHDAKGQEQVAVQVQVGIVDQLRH